MHASDSRRDPSWGVWERARTREPGEMEGPLGEAGRDDKRRGLLVVLSDMTGWAACG